MSRTSVLRNHKPLPTVIARPRVASCLAVLARLAAAIDDADLVAARDEVEQLGQRLLEVEDVVGISTPASLFDV